MAKKTYIIIFILALFVAMLVGCCWGQSKIPGRTIAGPKYLYPAGVYYEGVTKTVTGNYRIYHCKRWGTLQKEWERRNNTITKSLKVISFVDRNRMEIWYTMGILDRLLGKYRWYKTPLEIEMGNVSSYRSLIEAGRRDMENLGR